MIMDRVGAVGDKNWKFTVVPHERHDHRGVHHGAARPCSGTCDTTPGSQIICTRRQRQRGRHLRQHPVVEGVA